MSRFVISPSARDDIDGIWTHIASDNLSAADNVVAAIYEKFKLLAERPLLGAARPDLPGNVRCSVVTKYPNYLVLFRTFSEGIEILMVIHGARDVPAVFRRRFDSSE